MKSAPKREEIFIDGVRLISEGRGPSSVTRIIYPESTSNSQLNALENASMNVALAMRGFSELTDRESTNKAN